MFYLLFLKSTQKYDQKVPVKSYENTQKADNSSLHSRIIRKIHIDYEKTSDWIKHIWRHRRQMFRYNRSNWMNNAVIH